MYIIACLPIWKPWKRTTRNAGTGILKGGDTITETIWKRTRGTQASCVSAYTLCSQGALRTRRVFLRKSQDPAPTPHSLPSSPASCHAAHSPSRSLSSGHTWAKHRESGHSPWFPFQTHPEVPNSSTALRVLPPHKGRSPVSLNSTQSPQL